jgi:exosortase
MTARRSLALAVLAIAYGPTLYDLVYEGWTDTYAGHVLFVPAFAALLIWMDRDRLRAVATKGSPEGLAVVVAALVVLALGRWSSSLVLQTFSIVIAVSGLALWWVGWQWLRAAKVPIGFLIFMIPLPLAFVNSVTLSLQQFVAWSSAGMLELIGVPVHQEGVLLTLPQLTLEVAEVCNGLRFLMTLLVLTVAFAQVSQRTAVRKALLAAVAVPVAILANVVRITGIAFAVFLVGPEAASGFYHLLVGKLVWAATIIVLVAFGVLLRWTTTVPLEQKSIGPFGVVNGRTAPIPAPAKHQ